MLSELSRAGRPNPHRSRQPPLLPCLLKAHPMILTHTNEFNEHVQRRHVDGCSERLCDCCWPLQVTALLAKPETLPTLCIVSTIISPAEKIMLPADATHCTSSLPSPSTSMVDCFQASPHLRFRFFKESSNHQWLEDDHPAKLPAVQMTSDMRQGHCCFRSLVMRCS